MIRLLHISPSYYPAFRFGGPIQSVHLLTKALVKKEIFVLELSNSLMIIIINHFKKIIYKYA